MKKAIIVLVVLILAFIVGFISGSNTVLYRSPKWVEESNGQYLIVTDFMGNEYVDMADKTCHMYSYFSYAIERRP